MNAEIETWNARARYLALAVDAQRPNPVEQAKQQIARWRTIMTTCPSRELRAAAHPPGLRRGPAGEAVEHHREGCLVLSSSLGDGKTTAMCWRAYHARGDVLWLDAVRIATARTEAINRWLDRIRGVDLVLVDDVGAAGTVGQYESPRVAAILTAVLARHEPSIVSTNLGLQAFGAAYDSGGQTGRLRDRIAMRPNRWVEIPASAVSRRQDAKPPPGEDVLPPREARAQAFIRAAAALGTTAQACVMADVDQRSVLIVGERLGLPTLADIDREVAEHASAQDRVRQAIADLERRMRWPVEPEDPEPTAPEAAPGTEGRRRAALLDLVAYVAERLGCEEADVLARIGRERRTLDPSDEAALLALLEPGGGR